MQEQSKNNVKFEYHKETEVWSHYDDFEPTGVYTQKVSKKLEIDAPIEDYFNSFTDFLKDIGFDEEEIKSCAFRMYYYDKVSPKIPKAKEERILYKLGDFLCH